MNNIGRKESAHQGQDEQLAFVSKRRNAWRRLASGNLPGNGIVGGGNQKIMQ